MQQPIDPKLKQEFHKDLYALMSDIEAIKKSGKNPHFNSKFLPLPDMLNAVKPLILKHGFYLTQCMDIINTQNGPRNAVASIIVHAKTGINEMSKVMLPENDNPQKVAAANTYYRRVSLSNLLALQEEDDDGNTASGNKPTRKAAVKSKDNF